MVRQTLNIKRQQPSSYDITGGTHPGASCFSSPLHSWMRSEGQVMKPLSASCTHTCSQQVHDGLGLLHARRIAWGDASRSELLDYGSRDACSNPAPASGRPLTCQRRALPAERRKSTHQPLPSFTVHMLSNFEQRPLTWQSKASAQSAMAQ